MKKTVTNRNIALVFDKTGSWPRLPKQTNKLNWIKVDFTKFVDEDEEEEQGQSTQPFDMSQLMNNPNLMNMMQNGNAPPTFEDSDDEDKE